MLAKCGPESVVWRAVGGLPSRTLLKAQSIVWRAKYRCHAATLWWGAEVPWRRVSPSSLREIRRPWSCAGAAASESNSTSLLRARAAPTRLSAAFCDPCYCLCRFSHCNQRPHISLPSTGYIHLLIAGEVNITYLSKSVGLKSPLPEKQRTGVNNISIRFIRINAFNITRTH